MPDADRLELSQVLHWQRFQVPFIYVHHENYICSQPPVVPHFLRDAWCGVWRVEWRPWDSAVRYQHGDDERARGIDDRYVSHHDWCCHEFDGAYYDGFAHQCANEPNDERVNHSYTHDQRSNHYGNDERAHDDRHG